MRFEMSTHLKSSALHAVVVSALQHQNASFLLEALFKNLSREDEDLFARRVVPQILLLARSG